MKNDGSNPPEETNEIEETNKQKSPLFSPNEMQNIVKDFIIAWTRNQIKIQFPTEIEIRHAPSFSSVNKPAKIIEDAIKTDFNNWISICLSNEATPEQKQQAVKKLFNFILNYRLGDRIKGEIPEYKFEEKERIQKIEEKIEAINNVVNAINEYLFKQKVNEK